MTGLTMRCLLAAGSLLLATLVFADESMDGAERPTRILPQDCEAWERRVDELETSDDALERALGQFHADPQLRYCQTEQVRVSEQTESNDRDFELPEWLMLAELARWLSIAILAGLVLWLLWRWSGRVGARLRPTEHRGALPTAVEHIAMARTTALPEDIPAAALQAWQAGQTRAAMSLLYRGAVERLLPTRAERTEREVLEELKRQPLASTAHGYMNDLVQAWLQTAWGHSPPSQPHFDQLQGQWAEHCRQPGKPAQ